MLFAALSLVKDRLGLRSTVRDAYLSAIINGFVKEMLDEKGLTLDGENDYHLMFVVDFVAYRYQNRDSVEGVPRHLKYRLHNMMINSGESL